MSFAAGARVANNQNVAISRIEEEGKFRADRLAQVARAEDARTNANTISNNAKTATTTINANAEIEAEKAKRGDKGKTSMAGKLAGGAALIGAHYMMKNRKKKDNPLLTQQQSTINKEAAYEKELDAKITQARKELAANNPDLDKSSNNSTQESLEVSTATQPLVTPDTSTSGLTPFQRLNRVIFYGEGTMGEKGFTTQYGGGQIKDLSKHPDQVITAGDYSSTAAGKFQFLTPTWNEAKNALGLKDFSKESQLKAGRYLIQEKRGVNPDKLYKTKEEFKDVMDALAPEWASLPYSGVNDQGFGRGGSYYGQPSKTLDELWNLYNQNR